MVSTTAPSVKLSGNVIAGIVDTLKHSIADAVIGSVRVYPPKGSQND